MVDKGKAPIRYTNEDDDHIRKVVEEKDNASDEEDTFDPDNDNEQEEESEVESDAESEVESNEDLEDELAGLLEEAEENGDGSEMVLGLRSGSKSGFSSAARRSDAQNHGSSSSSSKPAASSSSSTHIESKHALKRSASPVNPKQSHSSPTKKLKA